VAGYRNISSPCLISQGLHTLQCPFGGLDLARQFEAVYQFATVDAAELSLGEIEAKLDDLYLSIGES
jgi:hypothetical protein